MIVYYAISDLLVEVTMKMARAWDIEPHIWYITTCSFDESIAFIFRINPRFQCWNCRSNYEPQTCPFNEYICSLSIYMRSPIEGKFHGPWKVLVLTSGKAWFMTCIRSIKNVTNAWQDLLTLPLYITEQHNLLKLFYKEIHILKVCFASTQNSL